MRRSVKHIDRRRTSLHIGMMFSLISMLKTAKRFKKGTPAAGSITSTFPDADGYVTVTATQGSVEASCAVLLINDATGEIVTVKAGTDGSFSGDIHAQLGDEIKIVMMDDAGNQTLITYITFKSDDGKYLVTAKGGTVTDDASGAKLEIPEGALYGPTVIKITPVTEDQLPPDNPVPAGGHFLAAVNIDTGGVSFNKAVQFSVPAPENIPADAEPFVARPTDYVNTEGVTEKVYEIVDSAKVIDSSDGKRLTTACDPFPGVQVGGTYVFEYPDVQPVILDGYLFRDKNGNDLYEIGTDYPISGAVVRSPDAMNYIAYTNSKGHYATYTWAISNTGTCRNTRLTAIDPYTVTTQNTNSTMCEPPYTLRKDFVFPSQYASSIDRDPPLIEITLHSNNVFTYGATELGSTVTIEVRVMDMGNLGTTTVELFTRDSMGQDVPVYPAIVLTCQPAPPQTINGINYVTQQCQASYEPGETGSYTVNVTSQDAATNTGTRTVTFSVMNPGDIPTGVAGKPYVLYNAVYPADKSASNMPDTDIRVYFSEPVNVDETTFKLKAVLSLNNDPGFTPGEVTGTVVPDYEGKFVKVSFIPDAKLDYATRYEISLSSYITDKDEGNTLGSDFVSTFETMVPTQYSLAQSQFSGRDVAVLGDHAYVAGGANGWEVVSIVDPSHPVVVFSEKLTAGENTWSIQGVATDGDAPSLTTAGTKINGPVAVLTEDVTFGTKSRYNMLRVYDVTNPVKPRMIGSERLNADYPSIPVRVTIYGGYAYVCNIGFGLQVVDIRNAIDSTTIGTAIVGLLDSRNETYKNPMDIAALKDHLYHITQSGHFVILSIPKPYLPGIPRDLSPNIVIQLNPSSTFSAWRTAVVGDLVYVDSAGAPQSMDLALVTDALHNAVHAVDISNPYEPKIIYTLTGVPSPRDIAVDRKTGMAYISTTNGFMVIDIKNPYHLSILYTLNNIGTGLAVAAADGWVYMANSTVGLRIVDLTRNFYITEPKADTRLAITNDANGNPEMPTITAKVAMKDSSINLENVKVRWRLATEYYVNTTAAPQRSRKGLDPNSVSGGTDGFRIPPMPTAVGQIDYVETTGPEYTINWGNSLGGGVFTITAEANINGQLVSDTFMGKVEGETFEEDAKFKENICKYLENPSGVQNYQSILDELGHNKVFRIIAYQETRYQHFYPSIYGIPKSAVYPRENGDGDGGFGVMQLTDWPKPSYLEVWNWKKNIHGGVAKVKESLRIAKNELKKMSGQLPSSDNEGKSVLRMEAYHQYGPHVKGSKYWKWDKDDGWTSFTDKFLYADILRGIEWSVDAEDYSMIPTWKYNGEQ